MQYSIFAMPAVAEVLSRIAELPIGLSGVGSYSYYHRTGDFLALHRDVVKCDLALLTCLQDDVSERGRRGTLRIYPSFALDPLSAVRLTSNPTFADVTLAVGESVLLMGGMIPHEVTPMAPGQCRTMSVMCYRIVT